MYTPQQLEQVAFPRVRFSGYSIDAVDAVLEPLIGDYCALYKENALLKNKMRVLVEKLEEYRSGEAAMRESMLSAQRSCDQMLLETEAKCAQMLRDANAAVAQRQEEAGVLIDAENQRVEEARRLTYNRIGDILNQLELCSNMLERIRTRELPREAPRPKPAEDADAVARQISSILEAMVGTTEDIVPKAPPRHPQEETTGRFSKR